MKRTYHFLFSVLIALSITNSFASENCAEVNVSLELIPEGQLKVLDEGEESWLGIYHRTASQIVTIEQLKEDSGIEAVPDWWKKLPIAKGKWSTSHNRSQTNEWFIFWDASPIFGCNYVHVPLKKAQPGKEFDFLGSSWKGGFFEPCYGIGYDYSGYPIFHASGLPENVMRNIENRMVIPPYKINGEHLVLYCE